MDRPLAVGANGSAVPARRLGAAGWLINSTRPFVNLSVENRARLRTVLKPMLKPYPALAGGVALQ